MSVPTLVQVTPLVRTAGYNGARSLTFGAAVAAGNLVVVCGVVINATAGSVAAITASVAMTGAVFLRRADKSLRYENNQGLTLWTADAVAAGATVVSVTPTSGAGDNNCALFAMEWANVAADAFEGYVGKDAESGVASLAGGPMPASGSPSQADTAAIVVTFANQGGGSTTDIGWTLPAGWTSIVSNGDPSGALRPIMAAYKTQATQLAVSVTTTSTQNDIYGRASLLLIVRGNIGSPPPPAPPPPGPAPSPPPPAVAQNVRVEGVQAELAGFAGVKVQVHSVPTTQPIAGPFLFGNASVTFQSALDAGKAVLLIPVAGVTIATGTNVIVFAQSADGTGGFRGGVAGVVVTA